MTEIYDGTFFIIQHSRKKNQFTMQSEINLKQSNGTAQNMYGAAVHRTVGCTYTHFEVRSFKLFRQILEKKNYTKTS